jgi:hypothetical protein
MTKKSSSSNLHMTGMTTILLCMFVALQQQDVVMAMSKDIRFASPLQSLTIPDPELFADKVKNSVEEVDVAVEEKKSAAEKKQDLLRSSRILDTPRKKFLPKFLTGLKAENQIREEIALGRVKVPDSDDDFDVSGMDWVGQTKTEEAKRKRREDKIVEDAYDKAITSFEQEQRISKKMKKTNSNKYQYVGVVGINKDKEKKNSPISWYARPKPKNSKWSVRLLHVNKDVIIKDLFDQGKIDIFAKYTNTGQRKQSDIASGEEGRTAKPSSQAPVVTTKYEARDRSWR